MKLTGYDYLNGFFKFIEEKNVRPAAQLLGLHLLHLNNKAGNEGSFYCSDNELRRLSKLSKKAVTDAKQALKALNILDFYTDKNAPRNGTLYTLNAELFSLYLGQKVGQRVGQTSRNNIISLNNIINKKEEKKKEEGGGTRTREGTPPPPQNFCSETLRNCWIKNSGVNPNDGICQKLGELEEQHGTGKVELAIQQANYSDDGGGINLNFVISKLNQILYSKKGEVKNGRSGDGNRKNAWDD